MNEWTLNLCTVMVIDIKQPILKGERKLNILLPIRDSRWNKSLPIDWGKYIYQLHIIKDIHSQFQLSFPIVDNSRKTSFNIRGGVEESLYSDDVINGFTKFLYLSAWTCQQTVIKKLENLTGMGFNAMFSNIFL